MVSINNNLLDTFEPNLKKMQSHNTTWTEEMKSNNFVWSVN